MKGKRLLAWAVIAAILLMGLQTAAIAEEATSGKCGDDLYWSYADGTLTITGSGNMDEFYYYTLDGEPVTNIPWITFQKEIETVVLPDGLTTIGHYAFYDCEKLGVIRIPDGVTEIGTYAFCDCWSLAEANFPDSLTTIYSEAFFNCSKLKSAILPDGITEIGMYAFSECDSLTELTVPKGLKTVPTGFARMDRSLREIVIPEGVTTIEACAFEDMVSLTKLVLPEGLTTVEERAFNGCHALDNIKLPESLTVIENDTYGHGAFTDTGYWNRYVQQNGDGPVYLDFALIGCEGTCQETVEIKDGTRVIALYAFYGHPEVKRVTVPGSMKTVSGFTLQGMEEITLRAGVEEIGMNAFAGCTKLKTVTVPTTLKSVRPSAFFETGELSDVYYLGTEETFEAQLKPNIASGGNGYFYSEDGACATWHFLDADPIASVELNPEDVQFKGATPYTVYDGSSKTPRVIVKDANGTVLEPDAYTVTYRDNAAPGTAYVDVYDRAAEETFTVMFKIYLPATASTTVANVQNGIELKWAKVPDAKGYVIYRRAWNLISSGWTEFKRWNNTTATEWTDTNVYAGTRYQYGIKAYFDDPMDNYNLGLVGPLKTTVRITTRVLKSVTPGSRRMTVKWDGSKLFTGYQIQYATDQGFTKDAVAIKIVDPKTYETKLTGLRSGKTYYVRLRSYHVFEGMTYFGQWSDVLSCKVK